MIKVFKLVTGEMVISEVGEVKIDSGYKLSYPFNIIPIPPEQGGQPNQIGFAKFMPFSDYNKSIILRNESIAAYSVPNNEINNAYESQVRQLKSRESGIILSQSIPKDLLKNTAAKDFENLNT